MDAVFLSAGVMGLLPERSIPARTDGDAGAAQAFDEVLYGLLLSNLRLDSGVERSGLGTTWNDFGLTLLARELSMAQNQSLGRLLIHAQNGPDMSSGEMHD